MKKILITNDDGIQSDGIVRLARVASKLGEVWVIAPMHQCSAMSHRITLREPIDVYPVDFPVEGVHAYAVKGTPGDCVRFGCLNYIEDGPDLVLSGVNYGYNCGSDLQYSATVGAAFEAASTGHLAIAFSEGAKECHEVADAYLEQMLLELMDRPLEHNQIWNVNFPLCPLKEYKGILWDRKVASNAFFEDRYRPEPLPDGGTRLTLYGTYHEGSEEGTDARAVADGYISVSVLNNIKEA